ncbi:MAG: hypothetical protein AB7J40_05985 [Candidatus Altimarinota bacterium]
MRSRNFYFLVGLVAVLLIGLWYFLKFGDRPMVLEETPSIPPMTEQLVEKDWVSFSAPETIVVPAFELEMDVLQPIDRIDVIWSHPSTEQVEKYSLQSFQSKSSEALYKVNPSLGNLLPGENIYEVVGVKSASGQPEQEFRASFTVDFDLKKYVEIRPSLFIFYPYPTETDSPSVALRGALETGVQQIRVYSFHERTGQATFSVLNKYVPLEKKFEYFIDEKFGNFTIGGNEYVIEAIDETDTIVARKYFTVRSTKLTFEDKVTKLFGSFQLVKGGWYVSSELPWFSVRPLYESVWIPEEEGKIVLPRPTLMYPVESTLETDFCEYLKTIDYARENYSYAGYSFETCQKFRYGVSVYDRFLSILAYQPFELVKRTDYKDVESSVSTAFVMIETGGMKTEPEAVSFDDASFALEESPNDATAPRYYVYQMMLQDQVPFQEDQIGDIAVATPEDRLTKMEEVKAFLSTYSGDEIFSALLFPESASTSPAVDSQ